LRRAVWDLSAPGLGGRSVPQVVAFLVSGDGHGLNGQVIHVDGATE
jgi:hypothetical protein